MNIKRIVTVAGLTVALALGSTVASQAAGHQGKAKSESNSVAIAKAKKALAKYDASVLAARTKPSEKANRLVSKNYGKAAQAYWHAKQTISKNFSNEVKRANKKYKAEIKGKSGQTDVINAAAAKRDAAIAAATSTRDDDTKKLGAGPSTPVLH